MVAQLAVSGAAMVLYTSRTIPVFGDRTFHILRYPQRLVTAMVTVIEGTGYPVYIIITDRIIPTSHLGLGSILEG